MYKAVKSGIDVDSFKKQLFERIKNLLLTFFEPNENNRKSKLKKLLSTDRYERVADKFS